MVSVEICIITNPNCLYFENTLRLMMLKNITWPWNVWLNFYMILFKKDVWQYCWPLISLTINSPPNETFTFIQKLVFLFCVLFFFSSFGAHFTYIFLLTVKKYTNEKVHKWTSKVLDLRIKKHTGLLCFITTNVRSKCKHTV